MSEKKGFIARLFGKQEKASCCAVRIEEVPKEKEQAIQSSAECCAENNENTQDGSVVKKATVSHGQN